MNNKVTDDQKNIIKDILPAFAILAVLSLVGAIFVTGTKVYDKTDDPVMGSYSGAPVAFYDLSDADRIEDDTEAVFLPPDETGMDNALKGGAYLLSGEYRETIYIDADDEIVHLLLDDARISSKDGPAVYVYSAAKVIISARDGSENFINDSPYYSTVSDHAAILSKAGVTVNGKGELKVRGNRGAGIASDGVFRMYDARLEVRSKGNCISADDGVLIRDSSLNIQSEKSGIVTGEHRDENKGIVYILSSSGSITAGNTGIISGNDLCIDGGNVNIKGIIADTRVTGNEYR